MLRKTLILLFLAIAVGALTLLMKKDKKGSLTSGVSSLIPIASADVPVAGCFGGSNGCSSAMNGPSTSIACACASSSTDGY